MNQCVDIELSGIAHRFAVLAAQQFRQLIRVSG